MINITLQQLRIFATAAKLQHITQASALLHLSQSAVSMGLAEFESQLGKPLFDRIGKKMVLNHHGQILLPKVETILAQVRALPLALDYEPAELEGELTIGASTTIANYLLPKLIIKFKALHPKITLHLRVGNSEEIISAVNKLDLDLGYIEGACHHPDILVQAWLKDEMLLIAAPSHSLTHIERLTWQDFAMTKWILREPGSGTRQMFDQAISKRFTPEVLLELTHSEAIKQAVMTGAGISCLSRLVVQHELNTAKLIALNLPGIHLSRQLSEIRRKGRSANPLILAWQNYVGAGVKQ